MFNLNYTSMKKSFLISLLVVVMMSGVSVLLTSCGSKGAQQEEQAQEPEEEQAPATDEQMAYACPMHPDITGKKGDTCSKCGMDLEEVTGEEEADTTHMHEDHH